MITNSEKDKEFKKTTKIASDTIFTGEIQSDGHVEIAGTITGNVMAKGDIKICGKVAGDVGGNVISLVSCKVRGNITADTSVFINDESVLVGNVSAMDMVLDGKMKGDVALEKSILFHKDAMLLGKTSAETISIEEGAVLSGKVRMKNISKNDSVFQSIND